MEILTENLDGTNAHVIIDDEHTSNAELLHFVAELSAMHGGQNVVLGENLGDPESVPTDRIYHAFASRGVLITSNLNVLTPGGDDTGVSVS